MRATVNLNKARKDRARTDAKAGANANAVKFGRSKAERVAETTKIEKARTHLEQHRLTRDDEA